MPHQQRTFKLEAILIMSVVMMFDKVRNTVIRKSLNIESLLIRIERFQLRWYGHVSRMPQQTSECLNKLPKQTLYAEVSGKRPVGRPRTRWLGYIKDLGWWNRLRLGPNESSLCRWIERSGGLIWS